ncbi:MAG: M1 family metallopeptidase [Anaerolineales bacterium]|nr:M1 family metallopeptidase [Anaerolineales bacterium]
MKWLSLVGLVTLLLLTACSAHGPGQALTPSPLPPTVSATLPPSATPTNTAPVAPAATAALPPEPTGVPIPERPQYQLSAVLDYGWRTLQVEQRVVYPHHGSEALTEIWLLVQPNWYPGVFQLQELTWGDGSPVLAYSLQDIRLRLSLPAPLAPGEVVEFRLHYDLLLPEMLESDDFGPVPFGHTSRQINLTDWYPFVPPYIDGQGWLAHNTWFYGEHLVYPMADFEVEFRLENAPAVTMIAASTLDQGDDQVHRYRLLSGRSFVLSISPEYRVLHREVDGVHLFGYHFPLDAQAGEIAFQAAVSAFQLYSQLFGAYPYESLSLVQADFKHGMEYQGLVFVSKGFYNAYQDSPESFLVTLAAHETAHQWWYGLVGNDPALEPWLDEALCTYSEHLFYEHYYPESLGWWKYARLTYYEPQGWVDTSIYEAGGYRPYRDAVYLRGAQFLDELRLRMGDEAFFAFLQDYVARYSYRLASADNFFELVAEHSSANLTWTLEQYFQHRR